MPSGKLLIVDDDRNLLELIKMRLESLDYEVTAAQDEEEAKKAVIGHVGAWPAVRKACDSSSFAEGGVEHHRGCL